MKVEKNKVVAVSYELQVEGRIVDKAGADKPLEYIHGTGMLLPKFEAELEGKEPGESFAFTLAPDEGYGVRNENYVVDIPKAAFMIDGKVREDLLQEGNLIPMLNSDGQVVQGTVVSVGPDSVKMDFNHPMAGKTLNFSGRIESVRDASEKDLEGGCHCGGECKHGECKHDGCEHGGCGHCKD